MSTMISKNEDGLEVIYKISTLVNCQHFINTCARYPLL